MYENFYQLQSQINENTNNQMKMLIDQIRLLLNIIEDHEKDMIKMAEKINELENRIS